MATASFESSAAYQALYQSTIRKAAESGADLMGKLVTAACIVLNTREAAARDLRERDRMHEWSNQLRKSESDLCKRYPVALLKAFNSPTTPEAAVKQSLADVQFDQLELMDEVQVLTSVALARAQQVAMLAADASLAELNTLISTALGLSSVQAERNPLRPEIYVSALKEVVSTTPVAPAVQLEWLSAMSAALGQQLKTLYAGLAADLRKQGVAPAAYSVLQTPVGGGRGAGAGAAVPPGAGDPTPPGAAPAAGGPRRRLSDREDEVPAPVPVEEPVFAERRRRGPPAGAGMPQSPETRERMEALLTLDKLRKLLSGELDTGRPVSRVQAFAERFNREFGDDAHGQDVPPSEFDLTVPAALEALTEMRQVQRVADTLVQRTAASAQERTAGGMAQAAQGPEPTASAAITVPGDMGVTTMSEPPGGWNAPIDVVRSHLRANVSGVAQALSLEVVTLMVDNMARDPRLLAPVQKLLRDMEPALLRLALADPRFFTDKQHPARMLLQDVTHRSLAYKSVDSAGFGGFIGEVQGAVSQLLAGAIDSAEPFEAARATLQDAWGVQEKRAHAEREQAVQALQNAEQRSVLAAKIAREIASHPDASHVPELVVDFLCGPWSHVVAQARIEHGSSSSLANKYRALISALLWSVHPELAHKNVAKLTKLVPLLLATMRDGLDTISYPPAKNAPFLEELMRLHQWAFRRASKLSEGNVADPAEPDLPPEPDAVKAPAGDPVRRVKLLEDGDPWVAPREAQASNFMDVPDNLPPVPVASAEAEPMVPDDLFPVQAGSDTAAAPTPVAPPSTAEAPQVSDAMVQLQDLPIGTWVELLVDDQWMRTQLTWASPHGTLFLFTSVFGTTQSMTRRTREKLVEGGRMRVISGLPVVEGALDAVAQIAMRNSMDSAG